MSTAHHGWRRGSAAAVAGAAVLGGAALTGAQHTVQKPAPEVFTAFVKVSEPAGAERSGILHVSIERWSTEEERQALVQAFERKGPEGLLSALRQAPRVGTLRASTSLGWDLHYAVQAPTADGGRRIVVGTDRRVSHWEVGRDVKTSYPFTLVELRLDKEDKGDGRMSLATKIGRSKDGKRLELEPYAADPLSLQDVRRQKN
jgi:hypothetical protein